MRQLKEHDWINEGKRKAIEEAKARIEGLKELGKYQVLFGGQGSRWNWHIGIIS